jgi:outer membrane protein
MSIRGTVHGLASAMVLVAGVCVTRAADAPEPLSLGDAVSRAAGTATPVAIALANLDATAAHKREMRSALLPHFGATAAFLNQSANSASFGFSFPEIPGVAPLPDLLGPVSVYDARLRLSQRLLDITAWKKLDAASSAVDASQSENEVTREEVAARAARAYLDVARETARVAARRSDAALAGELRELAEQQLQAGVATGIDVTRARAQEVTATSLLQRSERRAEQTQIALARALGLDAAARFELTDSLDASLVASEAPADEEAALRLGLTRRADLQVVAAREEGARMERAAIRAERVPRLELSADYGVNGPWDRTLETREIEVAMSLPLTDGRSRSARTDEQSARIRAAQLHSQDLRQEVEAEVSTALLELQSGEEQQLAAQERLRLAEDELAQARTRFANGVAGNIEVIDAQSNLNRAREALIEAQYTTAVARVELARASGVARTIH